MATSSLYTQRLDRRLPEDPQTRVDINQVLEHGYVVLKDVLSATEAEEAKAEIRKLGGNERKKGRNHFEGLDTTRIYSLLNKTRVFDKFCTLPRVLALNDYFLEPGYLLSALHSIQIDPGEKPQLLHHDDQFCRIPRPRPALGTAIILAFDDFTDHNGATRVVPGSHNWETGVVPTEDQAMPMTCPAGSALYFIGTTWHGGGSNRTQKPRMSATVQYCQPYVSFLHMLSSICDIKFGILIRVLTCSSAGPLKTRYWPSIQGD